MSIEGLPYLELLSPLIFVLGTIYVLSPVLPLSRSWARALVFAVVWLVVARYLSWRFFETVVPADGDWYEIGWVYFCFAVEALALLDAFILYLAFLRTSDRRGEADAHEARLRALAPSELPSVDVYIPTFNEPMEVLEKTITGVLCLDYPKSTPGCSMTADALGSRSFVKPRASVI
jgi:cellulose synthase (UDP-forming)